MKKRLLSGLTILALLTATPAFALTTDVYRNGTLLPTEKPVLNINDRTMMGFRDYFEATRAEVHWDDATRTATTRFEGKDIAIRPDEQAVLLEGVPVELDTPPQIVEGHIYLPLRFFGETMGYTVDFQVLNENHYRVDLAQGDFRDQDPVVTPPSGVITIPRTQPAAPSNGYFRDQDQLIELAAFQSQVEKRTINIATGETASQAFNVPGFPNIIDEVTIINDQARIAMNNGKHAAPWPLVGPGLRTFVDPLTILETSLGNVPIYGSKGGDTAYLVDIRQLRDNSTRIESSLLDFSQAQVTATQGQYAQATNGAQAVLVDNTFIIYNLKDAETLKLDTKLTQSDTLLSTGEYFVVLGHGNKGLSLGIYSTEGLVLRPYSILQEATAPFALQDTTLQDNTLHLLTNTGTSNHHLALDLSNPGKEPRRTALGQIPFTHFVPATDGSLYAIAPGSTTYQLTPLTP